MRTIKLSCYADQKITRTSTTSKSAAQVSIKRDRRKRCEATRLGGGQLRRQRESAAARSQSSGEGSRTGGALCRLDHHQITSISPTTTTAASSSSTPIHNSVTSAKSDGLSQKAGHVAVVDGVVMQEVLAQLRSTHNRPTADAQRAAVQGALVMVVVVVGKWRRRRRRRGNKGLCKQVLAASAAIGHQIVSTISTSAATSPTHTSTSTPISRKTQRLN